MRVAVVLSGCGYLDGSEVHEAVLLLLALDRAGVTVDCYAPDKPQRVVAEHLPAGHAASAAPSAPRNVLQESARIARGKVQSLAQLDVAQYDALAFPGGYGAAQTLCDFALRNVARNVAQGEQVELDADCARVVRTAHATRTPLLALCIAPALVASALRGTAVRLTIGNDAATAAALEALGATHVPCQVHECCVDTQHRIVSAPAYMYNASIAQVARGIDSAVFELLRLVRS
jgi:enhancing lycopene biosynthesis protein 2